MAVDQITIGENGAQHGDSSTKSAHLRNVSRERMGQTFSQIVAVLMRDPTYRQMRLADLEWLVLPPILAGQFKLARAPAQLLTGKTVATKPSQGDMLVPVGVALWARVSNAVDRTLTECLDKEVRLQPTDWTSGDKIWLMAVAGDPRALPGFLKQLGDGEFKNQVAKMRMRGKDGKAIVQTLGNSA
jgi:cytolysin-activating lysine-acyltransferase